MRYISRIPNITSELLHGIRRKIPKKSRDIEKNDIRLHINKVSGYSLKFNVISLIGITFIALICYLGQFRKLNGADAQRCESVFMYPLYARIDGFDTRYTPLAQKYHLYLYREHGKDKAPLDNNKIQLDGVPVLFIPGNAGSYKQVRSIAAEAANIYFDAHDTLDNQMYTRNLDFFTADFNEDFTAFHGKTMLDQAEYLNDAIAYILSLYEHSDSYDMPLPNSIIILAHSMGGIVARTMLTLDNHVPDSVNSILTLSSPHAAAPVTFDGDLLKIYEKVNHFWERQFDDENSFFSKHLSLISITGGISDEILPADYAAVSDLVPPKNGFTTFTSGIPHVWTPIDHLAIVWCKQLRNVVAKLLLEQIDFRSHSKTRSLEDRLTISKKLLLSGFENLATEENLIRSLDNNGRLSDTSYSEDIDRHNENSTLSIKSSNYNSISEYSRFNIEPRDNFDLLKFDLLTTAENPYVLFCKELPVGVTTKIKCVSAEKDIITVPSSFETTKFAASSSYSGESKPFKMVRASGRELSLYSFIIVKKPSPNEFENTNAFLLATLSSDMPIKSSDVKPFGLSFRDLNYDIHTKQSFVVETVEFPQLWSSLISYRISIATIGKKTNAYFEPFIRQSSFEPLETKWHVNAEIQNDIDINMHNVSPFIAIDESQTRRLSLDFILPPSTDIEVKLKINWTLTLKVLFIRYRLAIASFLVAFISLVLVYQFYWFKTSSEFVSFPTAMSVILNTFDWLIFCSLLMLTPLTNSKLLQRVLFILDPLKLNNPFFYEKYNIHNNLYYLGIRDCFSCWIGLLFGFMSIGALFLLCRIFNILEWFISKICQKIYRKIDNDNDDINEIVNGKLFDKKRFIACLTVCVAVLFYIPYQLAFIFMTLVQVVTCIKIISRQHLYREKNMKRLANLKHYNISILMLLLIVAIINTPIVIVFVHNLAINWETTFRSHHNILAIAPIIVLVVANSRFRIPSYTERKIDWAIIFGLFIYLTFFSLIYGIRNLYWIHHLVNVICGWLFYGTIKL